MVDETVDRGERHGLVRENSRPIAKGLVGGDRQRTAFVAGRDELEQDAGLRLILADIGEVIEDEEVILVELGERRLELEVAAGGLKPLHEVGGAGEQHAPTALDQCQAESCRKMRLSGARRAEHDQVGAFVQPAVASGECHDLRLADHGHRLEVEAVERLAGRQAGFVEMAQGPAASPFGHLVLGERGQKACGRPALLVGPRGEVRPDELDRGQAQIAKGQAEAGGVDRVGGLHGAAPCCTVPSSS